MKIIKRVIIFLITLLLILIGIYLYSRYIEPNALSVKRYEVNAPKDVSKFKIAYFSDTHFGKLYEQENIAKIVKKINAQNPDIVIFGGDFLDNYARDRDLISINYLKQNLSLIKSKYGKFAIWGNMMMLVLTII